MKKLIAVILALITLASLCPAALSDGGNNGVWTGEVISRQVSLFNQPSSGSGSSRKVKNGEQFTILEKRDGWVYAEVPNDKGGKDYGWIMLAYIVENPVHIVLRNNSGVYAYAAPYNTDKRVGTVDAYQRFTVIATTGNYFIVSFREAVCYLPMSADFWIEEDMVDQVNAPTVAYTVKANNTKVYGYPSTKYGPITTYKAGTTVQVLRETDGYAVIKYNNVIAFINRNDLQLK
ncbi:MAG: SH3 domain-containing protein [Clostridia bacterium]|nr:SH3 domain-containing protein [Clostridia bacterium]